jgi:hypothetical protein
MKESSRLVRRMVRESICGQMEKFTMESGRMVSKRAMESGREFLETHTSGSGRIQKLMDMGFTNGRMGISTKESGGTV